jgi:hypothetical protein
MALKLSLRVLTSNELKLEQSLCISLVEMINKAYCTREGEGSLCRFPDLDAMWNEMGDDGIFVILLDLEHGDAPVAVAGAKRWKKQISAAEGMKDLSEWEISPLATRTDPSYRKKGLVDCCLPALYDALLERTEKVQELRLWVQVVEDYYADYWGRKGYSQVGGRSIIPKGEWHEHREFTLVDMCKTVRKNSTR